MVSTSTSGGPKRDGENGAAAGGGFDVDGAGAAVGTPGKNPPAPGGGR